MTQPTDYKAEAMKLHAEMFYDTFPDKFDHTDCRTCGLITALLERLCEEARRAGAREALERAAQCVDDFYNTYFSKSPGQQIIDQIKDAIRALADQPEAEVATSAVFGAAGDRQDDEFAASEPADTPGTCALCGKPMPRGEEMFKYHGYSGPCPAPEAAHGRK